MAKRYGLTPEDADALFAEQGSRCKCCGTTEPGSQKGWVIDHCHQSGTIRGILCDACNVGLGRFNDSIDRLQAAIAYLERFAGKETT